MDLGQTQARCALAGGEEGLQGARRGRRIQSGPRVPHGQPRPAGGEGLEPHRDRPGPFHGLDGVPDQGLDRALEPDRIDPHRRFARRPLDHQVDARPGQDPQPRLETAQQNARVQDPGAGVLALGDCGQTPREGLPASPVAILAWLLLIAATGAVLHAERHRFRVLIYISVIGLIIALGFVHFSAPDLALTQISVEVVTILLLLLALNLLPKAPPILSSRPRRMRDAALAITGGLGVGGAAWAMLTRNPNDPISSYHLANSYSGGGGTNVVNVTLVDFRAFDTLGEIIVLGIAGLAIYALLDTTARGAAGARLRSWQEDMPHSPERHPMMFVMATRILLPLVLAAGIYIFLRGHNQPGGGFIAALIVAIAFLLQYLASGFDWTDERRRVGEHFLIGFGVLVAMVTGLGSLIFGANFLTSAFDYFTLPLIGEFELATALLFDIGVYAVVFGAVMLALAQLSHISQRAARAHAAQIEAEQQSAKEGRP